MEFYIHFAKYPNFKIKVNNIHGFIPSNQKSYTYIQAELVFTTSMNGYIETLTDPSYYNQAIVFTYPSIGNYGMPKQQNFYTSEQHNLLLQNNLCKSYYLPYLESNFESRTIQPRYVIVEKFVDNDTHELSNWFKNNKVPILEIHNIKPIINFIRDNGSQITCLTSYTQLPNDFNWIDFNTVNYQSNVSTYSTNIYPGFVTQSTNTQSTNTQSTNTPPTNTQTTNTTQTITNIPIKEQEYKPLLFIDFGCKYSQIREFIARGITVYRVPWNYLICNEIAHIDIINMYSGIFLSSGPGNPSSEYLKPIIASLNSFINYLIEYNISTFPIFGICFGHQLLGQALGSNISKLPFGHRGIHHPVKLVNMHNKPVVHDVPVIPNRFNLRDIPTIPTIPTRPTMVNMNILNNKGYITSQNHGYYLDIVENQYNVKPLFIHGFDNTNQGLYIDKYPIYSVQFHPEACPGPKDTLWLFDYFKAILTTNHATTNYSDIYTFISSNDKTITSSSSSHQSTITKLKSIKKVLLIGSGGLQIGQAGEFDYSCSQAIKAYQSLGIKVILLNPNVATIQTTLADQTYYLPLTEKYLKQVIDEQSPDAISYSFGGQTALNLGIAAYCNGLLNNIKVLGTHYLDSMRCEDRREFITVLNNNNMNNYIIKSINLNKSCTLDMLINTIANNDDFIKYPLLLRQSVSLGGLGSCIINSESELITYFKNNPTMEGIELCNSILGWKEIEVEVMRDHYGNSCIICGMENLDPVGFHTGESVVVAPCQTLNDKLLQECRTVAIKCAEAFNLVGEGNVQFAIHPITGEIKIIEMNPRLSRSSALASKATAYPIAYIAAKLQLGYSLLEVQNENVESEHRFISAFYEPVLDYFAIKVPRWDIDKLPNLSFDIGTSMKSVGEVLAINRTFTDALFNGLSASGNFTTAELEFNLDNDNYIGDNDYKANAINTYTNTQRVSPCVSQSVSQRVLNYYSKYKNTNKRWLSVINMIKANLEEQIDITITDYFINEIKNDIMLNNIDTNTTVINNNLSRYNTLTVFETIDSFAGEIPTKSNYRYLNSKYSNSSYLSTPSYPITPRYPSTILNSNEDSNLTISGELTTRTSKYKGKVIIIGCGTYRIGSSVEFDWCCVSSAKRAMELGYYVVMINDNPETVSTDYTECNCLYMVNPNITNLKSIYEIETELCKQQGIDMLGVIVSMGGQTSNNLVLSCMKEGINILGTSPEMIDKAEDRTKFSALLDKLNIDQPEWINAKNTDEVLEFCDKVGYPCIVRPSYVLSGAYMYIVNSRDECISRLLTTKKYNNTTITVSKFIEKAKEIDVDCISDEGNILAMSISEHVNHGVHSGDDILISPAQTLNLETLKKIKSIVHMLSINLEVSGPFNCQLLASNDEIKVIEMNLRASRTLPFISTLYKYNYISLATDIILDSYTCSNNEYKYDFNKRLEVINIPKALTSLKKNKTQTIGIKMPMFSFHRFCEIDQNLSVTMKSTGMTACFSKNLHKAYLRAMLSVGYELPAKKENGKLLLICGPTMMNRLDKYILMFRENNWIINKYETRKYNYNEYDLIFYITDKYLKLPLTDEMKLNRLRTVIRTRNEIKLLTPSLFGYLDKI